MSRSVNDAMQNDGERRQRRRCRRRAGRRRKPGQAGSGHGEHVGNIDGPVGGHRRPGYGSRRRSGPLGPNQSPTRAPCRPPRAAHPHGVATPSTSGAWWAARPVEQPGRRGASISTSRVSPPGRRPAGRSALRPGRPLPHPAVDLLSSACRPARRPRCRPRRSSRRSRWRQARRGRGTAPARPAAGVSPGKLTMKSTAAGAVAHLAIRSSRAEEPLAVANRRIPQHPPAGGGRQVKEGATPGVAAMTSTTRAAPRRAAGSRS